MNIKLNIEELQLIGVYQIKNLKNKKIYVGSTTVSFEKRLYDHLYGLNTGNHKNSYMQKSFNKHGKQNFEFSILEVCEKEEVLNREQYWIDKLEVLNKNKGYNINPLASGTPNMSKETIEKRRQTMLRKYANGELDHLKEISKAIGNRKRGIKLEKTDHLKVPKTITDKVIQSREIRKQRVRNNLPQVYVYDSNYNFLGIWNSIPELSEWSLTENNKLPIINRFKESRNIKGNRTPVNFLKSSNIQTSIKFKTLYKNLYFSYEPLYQVIDIEKLGEFSESPEVDNPELSTNLND